VISHVEDLGHFYVQYSSDTDNLQVLMTQLAEYCSGTDHTPIKFSSSKCLPFYSILKISLVSNVFVKMKLIL